MQKVDFQPIKKDYRPIVNYKKPFGKLEIRRIDHQDINYYNIFEWTRNQNCERVTYKAFPFIGLPKNSGAASVNFDHDIEIDESGDYWFVIVGKRQPIEGTISLQVNNGPVEPLNSKHTYEHVHWFDFKVKSLTAGSVPVRITVSKGSYVFALAVYKVEQKEVTTASKTSADELIIKEVSDLTVNVVNEMDTAKIKLAATIDDFTPDLSYSGLKYEVLDHVNFYVGNDENSQLFNMFGGYIIDPVLSDDNHIIEMLLANRMFDIKYRNILFQNFKIGSNVKTEDQPKFPIINFTSALEFIKYIFEASTEKGIKTEKVLNPYGFKLNFGNIEDFEKVICDGLLARYDTKEGSPAPSLQLSLKDLPLNDCNGSTTAEVEAVIFDDISEPFNAAQFKILGLSYMIPSCSCSELTKLQLNLGVTMFKAGETAANALEYNFVFTGKNNVPRTIGSIRPQYVNDWIHERIDLKAAFDKYAKSSAYYITKIRLWDTATQQQLLYKDKMLLYLDNILSFNDDLIANIYLDQATSTGFDIVNKLLREINYTMYIEYGASRDEDILVVAPLDYGAADVELVEGENIQKIANVNYNPFEYLCNKVTIHYHPLDSKGNETTASTFIMDMDQYFRFQGSLDYYEDLTGVRTKTEADKYANNYLEANKIPQHSYSLDFPGIVNIKPTDYVVTRIGSKPLTGNYPLRDIIYNFDFVNNKFNSKIDVGRASDYYYSIIKEMYKKIEINNLRDSRNAFNNAVNNAIAKSGASTLTK